MHGDRWYMWKDNVLYLLQSGDGDRIQASGFQAARNQVPLRNILFQKVMLICKSIGKIHLNWSLVASERTSVSLPI